MIKTTVRRKEGWRYQRRGRKGHSGADELVEDCYNTTTWWGVLGQNEEEINKDKVLNCRLKIGQVTSYFRVLSFQSAPLAPKPEKAYV